MPKEILQEQTAVDFLISELTKYGYIIAPSFGHAIIDELIKKAKEKENQQRGNTCKHNYILTSEQGHRIIQCLKCNNTQAI
jgi:hypothetical protein